MIRQRNRERPRNANAVSPTSQSGPGASTVGHTNTPAPSLTLLRCPLCRGPLLARSGDLRCTCCARTFPVVHGIPDFRTEGVSWINYADDRADALRLADAGCGTAEEMVRYVFSSRPGWDEHRIRVRAEQVLSAPERLRNEVRGWLSPCFSRSDLFLDLGCGPGMLLAAAHAEGYAGVGVDVSLVWLLVAQRLLKERGAEPLLMAALAEHLPFAENSLGGVVSLDVIEHVNSPAVFLREIDRVLRPDGVMGFSTPNRYSLAAEPHIGVWGVGWLPRRWQGAYVRWRAGEEYRSTALLSTFEAGRLMRANTSTVARILIPRVSEEEISRFPPLRGSLAKLYNRLAVQWWSRWIFRFVGPFFRVTGRKHSESYY